MNKRLVGRVILFLAMIAAMFVISLAWDEHLHTEEDLQRPNDFGSYQGYGYYKIDPETILVSLKNKDSDVFQPLLKDPNDLEEIPNISTSWSQADFMGIFSALGKFVWDDSMDSKVWNIYDAVFSGYCFDGTCELFDRAEIVYFKKAGNSYVTRIMDIQPYLGLVRWGDTASYPQPILCKWKGAEIDTSKITAKEALEIAEENGVRDMRLKVSKDFGVSIYSSRFNHSKWNISYFVDGLPTYPFNVSVDLETRETKFLNTEQKSIGLWHCYF